MKKFLLALFTLALLTGDASSQDSTSVLTSDMFDQFGALYIANLDGWKFHQGNGESWADPAFDDSGWEHLKPTEISDQHIDQNGRIEGWFRIKIRFDSTFYKIPLSIIQRSYAAMDVYVNGDLIHTYGTPGTDKSSFEEHYPSFILPDPIVLDIQRDLLLAVHFIDYIDYKGDRKGDTFRNRSFLAFLNKDALTFIVNRYLNTAPFISLLSIIGLLALLFWLLAFLNKSEKHLIYAALSVTCIFGLPFLNFLSSLSGMSYNQSAFFRLAAGAFVFGIAATLPLLAAVVFKKHIPKYLKYFVGVVLLGFPLSQWIGNLPIAVLMPISFILCCYYIISSWKGLKGAKWALVIGVFGTLFTFLVFTFIFILFPIDVPNEYRLYLLSFGYLIFPVSLLCYITLRMKEIINEVKEGADQIMKVSQEKEEILANQNELLEKQVNERTEELNQSLENLKATQSQLIHSEKMASLGELTAGIAHEIQNPLNFVNNFSEVSKELMEEMLEEMKKGDDEEVNAIASDIIQNLGKILHHGKRADGIVKGMLQHSRKSSAEKEPTDINKLADEYLRLAYHGLRAKDKTFNATLETDFDEAIEDVHVIPQDIGRVILNLITNAFYACNTKKKKTEDDNYKPTVSVSTLKEDDKIKITVKDNGNGIPKDALDKIFQPFFTTKPTGEGTGLGLSMSYDIITKGHGGELKVFTTEGEGTTFVVILPKSKTEI